ncbi:MAG: copper ion binding protein, partial [Ktedonobacteraceae bacterium]|nr:copper ion binding protein [Ktedonobacteraceae bacterium]
MATDATHTSREAVPPTEHLEEEVHETHHAVFALEGMSCASCAMRIEKGLNKVPGVMEAQVNFATEQAMVTYDPASTGLDQMVHKVEAVGYKAIPVQVPPPASSAPAAPQQAQTVLAIEGMTCASCAMRVEKGLKKVPGVLDAQVNLATEKATVTYNAAQIDVPRMIQKVEAIGYGAHQMEAIPSPTTSTPPSDSPIAEMPNEDEASQRKRRALVRKRNLLIVGVMLSLPIMLLSMFFMNRFSGENVLLLVLTTPVWAVVGWEFHRGALKALRHGSANMDTLVSMGSTAAYGLSL